MPVDLPQRSKPLAARPRWALRRIVVTAALLYVAKGALGVARACMWLVHRLDPD